MNIPKPLVQINQSFILITVLISLFFGKLLLLLPFVAGVITVVTKQNPVMLMGKVFLKKPFNQYRQEDREQQLFNQWIATICLGISLLAFTIKYTVIGYIFSGMVIIASALALSGYCIGCTIRYRYLMWKHHHEFKSK
ncbi:DUF4395 domain-containing protein [Bacillus salitolerans]|uniref:DUF4395 domain-containing protein n=1 Tax=Bacillus salitolerans TaxID=1437434 RepID=A0ABW4LRW1_9BACI